MVMEKIELDKEQVISRCTVRITVEDFLNGKFKMIMLYEVRKEV